jgi:hypothetical protein
MDEVPVVANRIDSAEVSMLFWTCHTPFLILGFFHFAGKALPEQGSASLHFK